MNTARRLTGGLAAVGAAVLALGMSGCGADRQADPSELDRYQADSATFFERFALQQGASVAYHYETFTEAAEQATGIAVAEVVDVRHTRTFVSGEEPRDRWPMIGVDLRIMEVLAGEVPSEVTVEFQGFMGQLERSIEAMGAAIPSGPALWFLRSKDDAYKMKQAYYEARGEEMPAQMKKNWEDEKPYWGPVSFQGVFIQGENGVVSAIAGDRPSGMAAQGQAYERLSDLVDAIRQLDVAVGSNMILE